MLTAVVGVVHEARSSPRRQLNLGASALLGPDGPVTIWLRSLSTTGLLMETDTSLEMGDRLLVKLPQGVIAMARVVWNEGTLYGCEFEQRISKGAGSTALLKGRFDGSPQAGNERVFLADTFDERWSWPNRMRLIIAVSAGLWALILGSVAIFV